MSSIEHHSISKIQIIVAGFATFAMFFGSGNLVFPIMIGSQTGPYWGIATCALFLSGVLVPFLGLVALTLLEGSQDRFFRWIGKFGAWIVPFTILLLIGPLGIIPRCVNVAYGAWLSFSSSTPLWLFAFLSLTLVWFSTKGNQKIVAIIGKYFTPIKLTALLVVIGGALLFALSIDHSHVNEAVSFPTSTQAFKIGFLEGYNTMDLMGAIFFGVSLVEYFKSNSTTNSKSTKGPTITAMAIGMGLLFLVYMALVYLGHAYSGYIENEPATRLLPTIAHTAIGSFSDYLISATLIVACMTTAVALMSVSVQFLCNKISFLKNKKRLALFACLLASFIVALTGFTGIMSFLAPILVWFYPVLIVLALLNIVSESFFKSKITTLEQTNLK